MSTEHETTVPAESAATGRREAGSDADAVLDIHCPQCHYNLRGLSGAHCTECGLELNLEKLLSTQLPWSYRQEIGRFRAYWRTVRRVLRERPRLIKELDRPVSARDAQLFRWLTLGRVYIPLLLATALFYYFEPLAGFRIATLDWAYRNVWPLVLQHLGLILFLAAASGLPTYFLHPGHLSAPMKVRAINLSYYCMAPLAWTPVAYLLSFFLYWLDMLIAGQAMNWKSLSYLAIILPGLLGVWWYVILLRFAAARVFQTRTQTLRMAILLPVLWVVLAGLLLVLLPILLTYVVLMITSWNQ